jgi:sialic acid synthase SpsE
MYLQKEVRVKNRVINEFSEPYIIAEMACAHEGSMDLAKTIIEGAHQAGADAIQFELFNPDDNIIPSSDVYSLLQTLYFSPAQWEELIRFAKQRNPAVFVFAYDFSSLKLGLELGADAIKFNSSDLSNPDMIELAARSNIVTTFGTGSSTIMEIADSLELFLKNGGTQAILMHGLQNFPTDFTKAHIQRVELLRSSFNCLVGYADHTDAELPLSRFIDLLALGMGACVLEKHITHDRSQKGIDHESALNPHEFREYVSLIREVTPALGPKHFRTLRDHDHSYRRFQKKWIVAAQNLSAGDCITRDNIAFLRSGQQGLSPMRWKDIVGKKLIHAIAQYSNINASDIEDY